MEPDQQKEGEAEQSSGTRDVSQHQASKQEKGMNSAEGSWSLSQELRQKPRQWIASRKMEGKPEQGTRGDAEKSTETRRVLHRQVPR